MARYSAFLGLQVEVQYRAGDILLPASGTFVGDTGRSVFLEQVFEQRGRHRSFRWEIPYQCIVRLGKRAEVTAAPIPRAPQTNIEPVGTRPEDAPEEELAGVHSEGSSAAAAGANSSVSVIYPRPRK
jgi:hypothetical protein